MTRAARRILLFLGVIALALAVAGFALVRPRLQHADLAYDVLVARPAHTDRHPSVLIDEAHYNMHRVGGTYAPFARLLRSDGYRVAANERPFTAGSLDGHDVLVVANALGARWFFLPAADYPAFTPAECDVVRDWVGRGGALLLVADHEPAGGASSELAERFGIEMSGGRVLDKVHSDSRRGSPTWLVFSRDNGLLADHAITRGRDSTERVRRVVSFTGQSLAGPAEAMLLALGDSAIDMPPDGRDVPARGRAQAVALSYGRGRVVVLGEAAMLTAQVTGGGALRFGMNWPGTDDRLFALNVVRWLSRAL